MSLNNASISSYKVLFFGIDTSPKSFSPLANRLVDNGLFRVSPDRHQVLLQLDQVAYWFLVHALLQAAPKLVIDKSGEMKAGVSWCKNSTVD